MYVDAIYACIWFGVQVYNNVEAFGGKHSVRDHMYIAHHRLDWLILIFIWVSNLKDITLNYIKPKFKHTFMHGAL